LAGAQTGEVSAAVVPLLGHCGTGRIEVVLAQLFLGALQLNGPLVVIPVEGDF
jgi:hypothetical protein